MGRLDYYVKGGIDKRLSKAAAQQLLSFVKIRDAALDLRYSAIEKIKTGLKIDLLLSRIIRLHWLIDDKTINEAKTIDEVVRWLRDTAVVSSIIEDSDKSWVKDVVSNRSNEAMWKLSLIRLVYR